MKDGIHPNYDTCTVRCACGATYETKSTKGDMKVDVCSKCHPFFTGQQKFVDIKGRIDKFKEKVVKGKAYSDKKATKKTTKKSN